MALSQTSLELDSLTVETLFNRGPLLSSSQAYIPILSSIGSDITNNNSYNNITHVHWGDNSNNGGCGCAYEYIAPGGFFQWLYLPVSTVYNNLFYSYSTPSVLLQPISSISSSNDNLSSSLHYNTDNLTAFSNANYSTLVLLSNIDSSTLSSYYISYSNDYNTATQRYITISNTLARDVPGLLYTSTTFTTVLFSNNASNIITIASNYYADPGGSRNVIPGINLMSNNSLDPDSNSTLVGYSTVLNSSITDFNTSNASLDQYRIDLLDAVNNVCTMLESGSSLSTLYAYSNSSFFSLISSLSSPSSFFDKEINSFSSLVAANFNSYIVPTQGPYISTGYSTLVSQQASSYSTVIRYVSSGTISTPIVVFSNIISTLIQSTNRQIAKYNYIPGFSTINFRFSTIVKPASDPLFISTNIYGYINLSTSIIDTFSSISSSLPYFVGSNLLSSISTLNGNVSTISTNTDINTSTIVGLTNSYITGPGISSLSTQFNSQIAESILDYENRVAETLVYFNSFLDVVNCIPGLSSLYGIGSTVDYTVTNQITIIYGFVNITYPQAEYNFFFNPDDINYVSVSTGISTNIGKYINGGAVAYSTNYFSFSNISTNAGNSIIFIDTYSKIPPPQGIINPDNAYNTFSSINSLEQSTLLDILSTVEGSNSYFQMLQIITDYSTSVTPPDILQSTFFVSVETSSIITQTSSFIIKSLLVQASTSSVFEVNGSAHIMPYSTNTNYYLFGNNNTVTNTYNGSYPERVVSMLSVSPIKYTYGTTFIPFNNSLVLSGEADDGSYTNNIIPLFKSEIDPFNIVSTTFAMPTNTNAFFDTKLNIQMFYNKPYYSYFKLDYETDNLNTVLYMSSIDTSVYQTLPVQYYTFSSITTNLATYSTLGPITSFKTNGSYYLLTATSNTYNNYAVGSWYPFITNKYYTLFVTSNINFSTMTTSQFSTPLISDPPVELHDSLWTGNNWVVAGNGVYTSSDALSWNEVLPPSQERLLQYKSMDFNGQDILLAHVSSSPINFEFLKSSDSGNTWTPISYITMPDSPLAYSDIGLTSTMVYSVNIKWAFNKWNAYINSFTASGTTMLYTSPDGGYTWEDSNINGSYWDVLPSKDTSAILFQPTEVIKPNIVLPNFAIYASDNPVINPTTQTLSVRFSSIIFNEGDLTIKTQYNPLLGGRIGIQNVYPSYALDIGVGNARKPSGTTWINPSDRRIKEDICEPNVARLTQEISSLRLVQYTWKESYGASHSLDKTPTLGFISQEVESIFPNSVLHSKEAGFTDFRTLNTDQIFKAKFGLTQQLLRRASTLQSRIDTIIQRS